jgi:hypothetical protein
VKLTIRTLIAGTSLLLAPQIFAQATGTSHPESLNDSITVPAPQNPAVTVAPPVAASQPRTDETYRPYRPPSQAVAVAPSDGRVASSNPADAGIVTSYPYDENALLEGTLIRARLVGELSTVETQRGAHFVATLSENVEHGGKVIFPVGATLEGRVTEVRSGKRITGGAAIHLEPETVTLPDGTQYRLNARVIDLDAGHSSHVNDEGTIVGGNHVAGHVTTLAATTGGGAITGAVLGGGVGAAVGAGVGAGVGTVLWLRQDRQQTLPEGTLLIFSLNRPMNLAPATVASR